MPGRSEQHTTKTSSYSLRNYQLGTFGVFYRLVCDEAIESNLLFLSRHVLLLWLQFLNSLLCSHTSQNTACLWLNYDLCWRNWYLCFTYSVILPCVTAQHLWEVVRFIKKKSPFFLISRGWHQMLIVINWVIPWSSSRSNHEVHICGFEWNLTTIPELIVSNFSPYVHIPLNSGRLRLSEGQGWAACGGAPGGTVENSFIM